MRLITFTVGGRYTSAYRTPLLAALMRPVHEYETPGQSAPLWVAADVEHTDGLRFTIALDTVRPIVPCPMPPVTIPQRIAWAILCARPCYGEERFQLWCDAWITGRDRTSGAALTAMGPGGHGSLPMDDRAYVAHWALMSAAFPHDPLLPLQTAALVAANLFPNGTFDFQTRAETALEIA